MQEDGSLTTPTPKRKRGIIDAKESLPPVDAKEKSRPYKRSATGMQQVLQADPGVPLVDKSPDIGSTTKAGQWKMALDAIAQLAQTLDSNLTSTLQNFTKWESKLQSYRTCRSVHNQVALDSTIFNYTRASMHTEDAKKNMSLFLATLAHLSTIDPSQDPGQNVFTMPQATGSSTLGATSIHLAEDVKKTVPMQAQTGPTLSRRLYAGITPRLEFMADDTESAPNELQQETDDGGGSMSG